MYDASISTLMTDEAVKYSTMPNATKKTARIPVIASVHFPTTLFFNCRKFKAFLLQQYVFSSPTTFRPGTRNAFARSGRTHANIHHLLSAALPRLQESSSQGQTKKGLST
jgi:hypothetical protein